MREKASWVNQVRVSGDGEFGVLERKIKIYKGWKGEAVC